eukprot:1200522-Rhodomonas_salina.1
MTLGFENENVADTAGLRTASRFGHTARGRHVDTGRRPKTLTEDIGEEKGVKVLKHDLPTNGIVYADVGLVLLSLSALDPQMLVRAPLFAYLRVFHCLPTR